VAEVRFTVLGKPQPAGSKKGFKHPITGRVIITDDNSKAGPWKQQVGWAAAGQVAELWTGALELTVVFHIARPKGHYRSGKNAHLLRDSAPRYPVVKPDATKLLRAVEDALTGVLWRDDAQIVDQHVWKRYVDDGQPERCEVLVRELEPAAEQLGLAA
jgi:Holliday junction resolvase RusA-like endonuclease